MHGAVRRNLVKDEYVKVNRVLVLRLVWLKYSECSLVQHLIMNSKEFAALKVYHNPSGKQQLDDGFPFPFAVNNNMR